MKFKVYSRDRRASRGASDTKFSNHQPYDKKCTTVRSSASILYEERLRLESPTVRKEVSAVVDALAAIEGDFANFKGFKLPGAWGVLADGTVTSVAAARKQRAWRRAKKITQEARYDGSPLFDRMLLPQLKEQALALDPPIALTVTETDVTPGYVGKQKGLKQILFERGWLDPDLIQKYYLNPKGAEEEDEPLCLKQLLSKCTDFLEEESQMVFIMKTINVSVEMSPKCHPELAGQGVEYCWGKSKKYYRAQRSAIAGSLSEDAFDKLVTKSLRGDGDESDAPMTLLSVLRFSRKAHFYRMAYHSLSSHEDTIKLKDIEDSVKMLKNSTYKEHRGVKRKEMMSEKDVQIGEKIP